MSTRVAQDAVYPYRTQVTNTPHLLSLLYDLDLLPEQIETQINAARMIAVCELFKRLPPAAVDDLIHGADHEHG